MEEFNERLVSVIIPVYNMELYLSKCIESVIEQKYKAIEIIIVDDGSTDRSSIISDEYAKKYSCIKVIHKENEGLVEARKSGIKEASGKYIVYVDADDYISDRMIDVFMEVEHQKKPDIIQCGMMVEYDDGTPLHNNDHIDEGIYFLRDNADFITERIFGFRERRIPRLRSNLWSCMFKKDYLYDIQMKVDGSITNGEDDACYYPYLLSVDTYYYIDQPLYYHYERNNSMSSSCDSFNVNDVRKIENAIIPYIERHKFKEKIYKSFNNYIKGLYIRHFYMSTGFKLREVFILPKNIVPQYSSIIIYGYGAVGKDYTEQLKNLDFYTLVGICDKDKEAVEDGNYFIDIRDIKSYKFDYIIIAIMDEKLASAIKNDLMINGVDEKKIIWNEPQISNGYYYRMDRIEREKRF